MIRVSGSGGKSGAGGGISEDPDTLSGVTRARYIDLIGEGEIGGLVNGEASIYLDGVPLRDLKGTPNYKPFKWTSTPGTSDQLPIPGFSGTSSEVGVGVNLTVSAGTVIRSIADGDADAVRVNVSVTGLSLTDSAGKISATTVAYIIRARRSGGAWVDLRTVSITGKTGARYPKSDEVLLTGFAGTGAFEVSVTRTTPDSASALLVNGLHWDSFTVINYEQYAYPHSALLALELDARYFSQIPARTYHVRGLLVRVPDNYDPLNRTYTGVWAGRGHWKLAYTDNPAWCYFDLITNRRYGLGRRISDDQVDVWELYTISKYCDEIVPTGGTSNISDIVGTGGVNSDGTVIIGAPIRGSSGEPRFTLNCVINTVDDAYRVLNQLSTAFRGMTYWGASGVAFTQDRPTTVSMLWNNANVDGKFVYAGSSKANRHTAVSVAWNDPDEDFRQRFEYVEDRDGIARYGVRSTEITAFGCTSRSQARRVGLWMLYTERMETDVITFRAGLDSSRVRPGDTGEILDSKRVGLRWGGRIAASTLTSITLDASVTLALGTYTLAIVAKDGAIVSRSVVISTAGIYATLNLTVALAAVPADMAMWVLSSTAVSPVTVRVINVRQVDAATYEFAVLRHNPKKYNAIDLGAKLAVPNYTALKRGEQPAVTGLVAVENTYRLATATASRTYLEVSWDHGVVGLVGGVSVVTKDLLTRGYNLVITKTGETPFTIQEQSDSTYTYADIAPGTYTVTVRPVSYLGVVGANAASVTRVVTGVDSVPPENVQGLTCTILTGGPRFAWTRPVDLSYRQTEIHIETVWNDATTPLFVGDANDYTWNWPTAGSYRAVVKHRDTAGNMSVTAVSVDFTIGANIKVDWTGLSSRPPNLAALTGAENLGSNLVSANSWVLGSTGSQTTGAFSWTELATSAGGVNTIQIAVGPDGTQKPVWLASSGSAAGTSPEGGFNGCSTIPVDITKPYRFSVWFKCAGTLDGSVYLGIDANSVDDIPSGTTNSNPYFHVNFRAAFTTGGWYLAVGYVMPSGYSGAQNNNGRIYDGATGLSVVGGTDFRWHAGITSISNLRAFQHYTGGTARYTSFVNPRFEMVDGTEPSVGALMADAILTRANSAYTTAAIAQTSANTANTAITNIASDSILSPGEKPAIVQDYAVITGEQAGIDAQAAAYSITTEKTAYDAAVTALTTYLGTLIGWNTVPGSDVAIVGTTFRSKFADVYTTRQAVLNKIAEVAGTRAAWASVTGTGKPADNATIGTALNADPYMVNPGAWASFDGSTLSFATVSDGKVGVGVARSPAAGTTSWGNGVQRLAVDHAKTYRISGWLRTVSGSGSGSTAYLGAAVFDGAGANIAGDGSQWYYAAAVDPSTSWTRYSGLFGFGTAQTFPVNARTMAPLFILSIGGFNSVQELQDLRIEEVTEVLAAATTATWAGIPSGTGKADDYATRNVIYRQIGDPTIAPGSIVNGATWLELDSGGTTVINTYHRVGGAWVLGPTGPAGYSSALVTIYKRSATLPTVPTATATYTFASGISGLSNGWSATPQAGTDPQYVTVATASSQGTSDTIATGEWAGPVIQVQDGTSGTSGLNSATVYLFQRTATSTAPALPGSSITYTFASALATGITNGWAQSLPTTGGTYRWVTTASALSTGTTDTIAAGEWAAAALLAQDGTDGVSAPVLSLSRTTVNFAADSTGLIDAGQSFTSTVLVMLGAANDTSNWSLSATTSDGSISGTLSGAVVTLDAMGTSVDAGTVTITATKAGYANQTAVISVGKIKRAVAATGPVASLGSLFAENYTTAPSHASATVQFRRDGTVWTVDDNGTVQVGSWYLPNGTTVGDNYQVRFDQVSSAADGASSSSNSANGAWSTLTALRSVSLINTVNSNSFKTATVAYSVRPLAGGSTVISGTIQLTASVEI